MYRVYNLRALQIQSRTDDGNARLVLTHTQTPAQADTLQRTNQSDSPRPSTLSPQPQTVQSRTDHGNARLVPSAPPTPFFFFTLGTGPRRSL